MPNKAKGWGETAVTRRELGPRMAVPMTFVLNFGHPLSDGAQAVLEEYLQGPVQTVRMPFELDLDRPTGIQVTTRVNEMAMLLRGAAARLDGTAPVVVVLPGITEGAAALLAELHGRLGAFPRVVRLRRRADGTWLPDAAEPLLDLEKLRNEARGRR